LHCLRSWRSDIIIELKRKFLVEASESICYLLFAFFGQLLRGRIFIEVPYILNNIINVLCFGSFLSFFFLITFKSFVFFENFISIWMGVFNNLETVDDVINKTVIFLLELIHHGMKVFLVCWVRLIDFNQIFLKDNESFTKTSQPFFWSLCKFINFIIFLLLKS